MELLPRKVAYAVPVLKWLLVWETETDPDTHNMYFKGGDPGSVGAQWSPTNSAVQWTYRVSQTCGFNFSSGHSF